MPASVSQRTEVVLRFLRGLGIPHVRNLLAKHGFTAAEYEEGWRLLREATEVALLVPPPTDAVGADDRLDTWENKWFPIAKATLAHNFPELERRLFAQRPQTSSKTVVLNVAGLLDELNKLERDPKFQDAIALLAKRGLDSARRAEAQTVLDSLTFPSAADDGSFQDRTQRRTRASEALWNWYLEWSAISRIAIRDRATLRLLGFRRGKPRDDGATERSDE